MKVGVVGASSGLGAAIAACHSRRGDHVVAVARRMARLEEIADALRHSVDLDAIITGVSEAPQNGHWVSIQADVTATVFQQEFLDALTGAQRIYLVAGVNADPRSTFETNVLAPIRIAQAVDSVGLQLVVISSLAAVVAFPGLADYCASKAALEQWMACWRSIAHADVLVIRPGQFDSEFHSGPQTFDFEGLPHQRALEVAQLADHYREGLHTIGWRDRAAAFGARLVGPKQALRLL